MTNGEARQAVADSSRVLAAQGLLDAFGHVSCRAPDEADHFLISRSLAPALVTADDVVVLDLDGELLGNGSTRLFLERFIHAEIYRVRPDVHAIVHSHAPAVLPFTIVPDVRVQPSCHMCGFLQGTPAPFDVADHEGDGTDLLIRSPELGTALAAHLATAGVVLMRGHGFTAVGTTLPEATYRAIYTARNCDVQAAALRLGTPTYLSEAEAAACERALAGQIDRAWNLWLNDLAAASSRQTIGATTAI